MTWRENELSHFEDKIVWLKPNESLQVYNGVIKYSNNSQYGLKPEYFSKLDKIKLREFDNNYIDNWLNHRISSNSGKINIIYDKKEVFEADISFFLENWEDLFCPSRDDVLITNKENEWLLYYNHEDEIEFGILVKEIEKVRLFPVPTLLNQQSKLKIKTQVFSKTIINSLKQLDKCNHITIAFVSNNKIKQLNSYFRNKDSITDVLSFPYESDEFDSDDNHLGDIVISIEQANKQAIENNLTLELEIKQLILHGILHLCGYDHETDNGEMNELELKLRDKLGIN